MNAWLKLRVWKLLVALGLVEPPRLQPIAIRHEAQGRRAAAARRGR